jgi:pimeloyl-ACP methyl ester carboxylesterase
MAASAAAATAARPQRRSRIGRTLYQWAVALAQHRGGDGPPLVLLHGLGLSKLSWNPVLAALEEHHDVIALDLPGFGDSGALDGGRRSSAEALADALEAEFDDLGLERPAVAGNSLGGWVALELARRGRTGPVVAIAPAGLETPAERAYIIGMNEVMRARARVLAPFGRLAVATAPQRTLVFGALRSRPWRMSAGDAAAELAHWAGAPGFHGTLLATEGARFPRGLGEIAVPARIAFGTRDLLLGALTAPRFALQMPTADLRALPGVGHVPMADDPELVSRTILEVTTAELT